MLRGVNGKEAWDEFQTVVVIDIAFLFLHTTAPDAAFDCAEQSSYTYTQTILRSLTCHCIISAVDVAYHQPGILGVLGHVLPPRSTLRPTSYWVKWSGDSSADS